MKLVVDMCLPPDLATNLAEAGYDALHWSSIGDPKALDLAIIEWAKQNGYFIRPLSQFMVCLCFDSAQQRRALPERSRWVGNDHVFVNCERGLL